MDRDWDLKMRRIGRHVEHQRRRRPFVRASFLGVFVLAVAVLAPVVINWNDTIGQWGRISALTGFAVYLVTNIPLYWFDWREIHRRAEADISELNTAAFSINNLHEKEAAIHNQRSPENKDRTEV